MLLGETPLDLDQRLKSMIRKANMTLTNAQHCTWFVASLSSHLRTVLSQQKLSTQVEALEMAMRLHENHIQYLGLRVQQIHVELQNLCLEMQSLKQDRTPRLEACKEVWCIKCKGQGHDKDHYLVFANYLVAVGPIPLRPKAQAGPNTVTTLWCTIYQIGGKHNTDSCHLLQKYTQMSQQLFCNFCRLVGHDECTCKSYELMMDQTSTYRVKTKTRAPDPNAGMEHTRFQGHR